MEASRLVSGDELFPESHRHYVLSNDLASWRLTYFYGFPEISRRKTSWDFLRSLCRMATLPCCIFWDFNDLIYASDKMGNIPHPQFLLDGFRSAIEDSMLAKIDLSRGKFT